MSRVIWSGERYVQSEHDEILESSADVIFGLVEEDHTYLDNEDACVDAIRFGAQKIAEAEANLAGYAGQITEYYND